MEGKMKIFKMKIVMLAAVIWFGGLAGVFASEFASTEQFAANSIFYNVSRSTGDNNPTDPGNWLKFWKRHSGFGIDNPSPCAVTGCTNMAGVGGHVVKNSADTLLCNNTSKDVYILPICRTDNHYRNNNMMTTKNTITAVKLKNYGTTPGAPCYGNCPGTDKRNVPGCVQ